MHVLLPVDPNEDRARAAAKAVAALPNAADAVEVLILNVHERIEIRDAEGGDIDSADWFDETDLPASVLAAEEVLTAAGIAVETRRSHGDPGEVILETAEETGTDMIVMAGRKRTPVGKVLFGSVTQSVLLSADIPVTVVAAGSG